jgi:hypothetical protein
MSELRVTMLVADPKRSDEARLIRDLFGWIAPYCGVGIHALESIEQLDEASPRFARRVKAALSSDIVLFFGLARDSRTNALLIAFRERSGFTLRLHEPRLARIWATRNGRRSFYEMGNLPAAYETVATALEYGFGDKEGARRLRRFVLFGEQQQLVVV